MLKKNILFNKNILNHTPGSACIIAEAGINHDGCFEKAIKLIDVALEAGCDCVKFQTFKTEKHMSVKSISASYIEKGSEAGESFFELAKRLELSFDEQRELYKYAKSKNLPWISSFFDEESLELLLELETEVLKLASGEITNIPLLKKAAKSGKPMIISTGMATLDEIDEVMVILKENGAKDLMFMHCVSWYPASVNDMNIKIIDKLSERYGVPVGLSDHTMGLSVSLAARARGVKFFEKHYTLSRDDFGPDHTASLDPIMLKDYVVGIDEAGRCLGDGVKNISEIEMQQRRVHRKSVISEKRINAGTIITEKMITIKRPGFGIEPKFMDKVIGKVAKVDIEADEIITWEMLS